MIPFIICLSLALIFAVLLILSARYDSFKNWLVYAVTESEQLFGGGTGKLKLRYAYDLAIKAFPVLTKVISWRAFSECVDEALDIMRDMIKHNDNINAIITGKDDTDERNRPQE